MAAVFETVRAKRKEASLCIRWYVHPVAGARQPASERPKFSETYRKVCLVSNAGASKWYIMGMVPGRRKNGEGDAGSLQYKAFIAV